MPNIHLSVISYQFHAKVFARKNFSVKISYQKETFLNQPGIEMSK